MHSSCIRVRRRWWLGELKRPEVSTKRRTGRRHNRGITHLHKDVLPAGERSGELRGGR